MAPTKVKRKLITILSADVKGYSRLMHHNDVETVNTLKDYRKIMSSSIQENDGIVIDSPGDNLLAEFSSSVNAVNCSVDIQKKLYQRNVDLPANRRMVFRIGINIGDVIYEEGRIYGDGVNIAARIEALSDPGGICISRGVYDQVKNHFNFTFEYLGEHHVKNILDSVRIYRICIDELPSTSMNHDFDLPANPSIAVLPFVNLKGDKEEEIFCDGLTEDIIVSLSKVSEIFVIARNSSFFYKGKTVKIQQIGKELGVLYILEGSVRKSCDNLRVTAQLVNAKTGHGIWADRFDRQLKDVFSLQDEIALNVLKALQVRLTHGEQVLNWTKGTGNIDVYLKWLKGRWLIQQWTKSNISNARKKANEIIESAPHYSKGYRLLGSTHMCEVMGGWSLSPKDSLINAIKMFRTAIKMDESETDTHAFLGYTYTLMRENDKAITEGKKAIACCPNSADAHLFYGMSLSWAGKHEEAILMLKRAMRLNPLSPPWYSVWLGHAYRHAGFNNEAATAYKHALKTQPEFLPAQVGLAVVLKLSGHDRNVNQIAEDILKRHSKLAIQKWAMSQPFKHKDDLNSFLNNIIEIGLIDRSDQGANIQ